MIGTIMTIMVIAVTRISAVHCFHPQLRGFHGDELQPDWKLGFCGWLISISMEALVTGLSSVIRAEGV